MYTKRAMAKMPHFQGYTPDAVSNYFLAIASGWGAEITPMKLQKLMYFAHGFHLALEQDGCPLVSEDCQAWEYGPVFPSTYQEFKDLGNKPIDRRAASVRAVMGGVELIHPTVEREYERRFKRNPALAGDLTFAKAVMDRIWHVYGRVPATKLSEMTHERGSPWWTVREKAKEMYRGAIPMGLNIPNATIRDWFKKRFPTPVV
jgi:uncharacterized phage-associated protein